MDLRHVRIALALVAALCSASASACGGSGDKGVAANQEPVPGVGTEMNPYGVPYPRDNIGTAPRRKSPGNVIANLKFLGYRNDDPGSRVDVSGGLQTISLADFYDPESRSQRVIQFVVASVWCDPCVAETKATVPKVQTLASKGMIVLQALADGPILGRGATKRDLDGWIVEQKTNFTQLLDPNVQQMGIFFDAAAVPFNIFLDARTMELLYGGTGAVDSESEGLKWLRWVQDNPPSYELPPKSGQ